MSGFGAMSKTIRDNDMLQLGIKILAAVAGAFVAAGIPYFDCMLGIVGAIVICSLFVCAPCVMYVVMMKEQGKGAFHPIAYFVILVGVVCFFIGSYDSTKDLIDRLNDAK